MHTNQGRPRTALWEVLDCRCLLFHDDNVYPNYRNKWQKQPAIFKDFPQSTPKFLPKKPMSENFPCRSAIENLYWQIATKFETYLVTCSFAVMDPQTLFHGSISGVWAMFDYWSPVLSFIIRLMQLSDSTPSWCIKQYQSNWASLLHDPAVINSLN